MAEVIATFGALSSFSQLVDFTAKVTKQAREIISDKHGPGGHLETERLAREYQTLASAHTGPAVQDLNDDDEAISRVRKQCQEEAHQLLEQLEALKITPDAKGAKRFKEGTQKAIRAVSERKKIEQRRLTCRS